jgi:lysozyme
MNTSPAGRELIERNEGCRLTAYQDIVGVWTIGYGHTEGVQPGQTITQAEADRMLSDDLAKVYGPGVQLAIGDAPTTQSQFDALVSLAYNIGVVGVAHSTVMRMHKAGNYRAAADAFLLWDKAGGEPVAALGRRRREEAQLYLSAATDTTIKALQSTLQSAGFYKGAIDGRWGPQSRDALSRCIGG